MFVTLSVRCDKSSDQQCSLSVFNMKAIGTYGIVKDAEWFISGVEGMLEDTEFYGGATITGNVAFL